ncbi:hypothetical protein AHAS_Ahas13G0257000 [Arachis hypogaea]
MAGFQGYTHLSTTSRTISMKTKAALGRNSTRVRRQRMHGYYTLDEVIGIKV